MPFEYHGLSDDVDRRAELVFEQLRQRVADLRAIRALGFCVSVAHADYMAEKFTRLGVPAVSLHGGSSDEERRSVRHRLESREIHVVFTCDLYNEGVDLPFVDTLLFLRPTASVTLFLQQLGRGLRLHPVKSVCLVLDFIGMHREDHRFDGVLTALTGLPRGGLRAAVEADFPLLPSGCQLMLDRVAQAQVLDSLKRTLRGGTSTRSSPTRSRGPP